MSGYDDILVKDFQQYGKNDRCRRNRLMSRPRVYKKKKEKGQLKPLSEDQRVTIITAELKGVAVPRRIRYFRRRSPQGLRRQESAYHHAPLPRLD